MVPQTGRKIKKNDDKSKNVDGKGTGPDNQLDDKQVTVYFNFMIQTDCP